MTSTTNAPRVEACIDAVMARYSLTGQISQAKYYKEVHQHLTPLVRDLEHELAQVTANHGGDRTEMVELEAAKRAGSKMANIFFNLAQRPWSVLTPLMCEALNTCRKDRDDAIRALKPQRSESGATREATIEECAAISRRHAATAANNSAINATSGTVVYAALVCVAAEILGLKSRQRSRTRE